MHGSLGAFPVTLCLGPTLCLLSYGNSPPLHSKDMGLETSGFRQSERPHNWQGEPNLKAPDGERCDGYPGPLADVFLALPTARWLNESRAGRPQVHRPGPSAGLAEQGFPRAGLGPQFLSLLPQSRDQRGEE